jgi:hypothetical protein
MPDASMRKWRSYLRNSLSIAGLFITLVSTVVGLPLMFFDIITDKANPYAGIFIYSVLPGLAAFGVFMALAGAYYERL